MKESVKIDADVLKKVRNESPKKGQTIGGFIETAIKHRLKPSFVVFDNSDKFIEYLESKKLKYKNNGHSTIVEVGEPIEFGIEWGIYKALNDPKYKKQLPI